MFKQNFNFYLLSQLAIDYSSVLSLFFIVILDDNHISDEGAKALAEALKVNKNLIYIRLGIFLLLFTLNITIILLE